MYISELQLRQFRNYRDTTYTLQPDVTVIVGPNGSGKTNILEALYVVATGKSFRDSDEHLAKHGEHEWKVTATVDDASREVRYQRGEKSITINDRSHKRMGRTTALPVVLFEPDHLMLIHGSPSGRRKYLDQFIMQYTPGYAATLRRYERVVAQRNRLLKRPQLDQDELFVWDVSLVELAQKITTQRLQCLNRWNETLTAEYQRIAQRPETIQVAYSIRESDQYAHTILQQLKAAFHHDQLTGSTSVGPHRDDYTFYLDKRDMATVASRGEIRTLLLSLKYIEADLLLAVYGATPLLLFDDVFSELDEHRQQQLLTTHKDNQIIITTTHATVTAGQTIVLLKDGVAA